MWFGIVSLFPEMFQSLTEQGVTGRAFREDLAEITFWNPRDYTLDVHRTVDDRPYGGGPGMVMKAQPLADAIDAAQDACIAATGDKAKVVYLSPQGELLTQDKLARQVEKGNVAFLCGRYEGIDERLIQREVDAEWSLGDYVISGGELAAMVCIDAMTRLIPGALGHADSAQQDSFSEGLLDCPHYTRPEVYRGDRVPEVLMSGNHREIDNWRRQQALGRTWQRRPDLLENVELDEMQRNLLNRFITELEQSR